MFNLCSAIVVESKSSSLPFSLLESEVVHVLVLDAVGLADGVHDEPDVEELLVVEDEPSVEDESRLRHRLVHLLIVVRLERIPLGHDGDRVGALHGLVGVLCNGNALFELLAGGEGLVVGEVPDYLFVLNLGIVDGDFGPLRKQMLSHVHGCRLACVAGVLLEGEPEQRDLLAGDGVEHASDHLARETQLLVVVDLHDLVPVLRDLLEPEALAEVDEVQDVFLEARSSETDGCVQETLPDASILAYGPANLLDIGPGGLA
mmetsp:Transcript_21324/g.41372  ORF Transcript_21324/g.41372 Transcript_21324/m.41372 type:complete len:260 (-) Transcript_21324:400-1179(-)